MKRFQVVLILVVICIIQTSVFAKGRTVKIAITSEHLSTPIESTNEAVGQFGVWEGPGVVIGNVPQAKGFIADWSRGIITGRRNGLERYEVSFYEGCKFTDSSACHSEEPSLAYVVFYEYDPSSGQGYVYLPGKDDEWYEVNVRSIYRKVEGNWFSATNEWQSFVLPLIQQAER
jgi:uncharacterized membrane protein (Fun14 family)